MINIYNKNMSKLITIILSGFILLLSACSPTQTLEISNQQLTSSDVAETNNRLTLKVVKVIDGDTIKVDYKGKSESLRFLLIDTPEMHDERFEGGSQPFAIDAKDRLEELLKDRKIDVEIGIQERDKYGRLLGYVFVNNINIQEILLKEGLARVAYVYNDKRYLDNYLELQSEAKKSKIGIWSLEDYASEKGFAK